VHGTRRGPRAGAAATSRRATKSRRGAGEGVGDEQRLAEEALRRLAPLRADGCTELAEGGRRGHIPSRDQVPARRNPGAGDVVELLQGATLSSVCRGRGGGRPRPHPGVPAPENLQGRGGQIPARATSSSMCRVVICRVVVENRRSARGRRPHTTSPRAEEESALRPRPEAQSQLRAATLPDPLSLQRRRYVVASFLCFFFLPKRGS
jgi:hypothetical protein